eukprot:6213881-Pleurochrysis_carterae.AAC.1
MTQCARGCVLNNKRYAWRATFTSPLVRCKMRMRCLSLRNQFKPRTSHCFGVQFCRPIGEQADLWAELRNSGCLAAAVCTAFDAPAQSQKGLQYIALRRCENLVVFCARYVASRIGPYRQFGSNGHETHSRIYCLNRRHRQQMKRRSLGSFTLLDHSCLLALKLLVLARSVQSFDSKQSVRKNEAKPAVNAALVHFAFLSASAMYSDNFSSAPLVFVSDMYTRNN